MTDRSSEERSRTWKPLVEVIRREMLARFSDKLSMEEIASCAYAVAALEDRQEAAHKIRPAVGEEIRDCCGDRYTCNVDSVCSCGYAGCRSHINTHLRYYASGGVPSEAKNDRQEVAPEVGLRIDNLINYADSLQSETIYLDPDDIAFVHEYYGCKTGCCTKFAGKIMRPKVGVVPGVPSEATPTKENAPSAQKLAEEYCTDMIKTLQANVSAERERQSAPAPEVQETPRSLGKLIHDATIQKGGEFVVTSEEFEIMCAATPGPRAVGAPLFCGKKLRIESPVGTPQKETPTMPYGAGAQNFGVVPEGVQGKELQTFEESWANTATHSSYHALPNVLKHEFKGMAQGWWAAGRRSAALLEKDLLGALKAILATVVAADYDDVQLVNTSAIERAKTVVACAELQEKTK